MYRSLGKRMAAAPVCIVSLILLSACATPPPSISDVDVTSMPDNQALLIFSTGSDETCMIAGTSLVIKKADAEVKLSDSIGMFQANNPFVKSDFEEQYGKVYTIAVEPGDYDFWLWVNNPTWYYKDPILTEDIRVEAGQIRYIGEFFLVGCGAVDIYVRDRSERDIEFLQRIKPSLNAATVVIDLARIRPESNPADKS